MAAEIRMLRDSREILIASRELQGLRPLLGCLSPRVEARLLDGDADPLPAIMAALALDRLDALHLVGAGAPGEIAITRAPAMDAMAARGLAPAAARRLEINIWASHAGAGARGRHFVQALAEATHARVLASDGIVGGPDAGASWDLAIAARPRGLAPFARPARDALSLPVADGDAIGPDRTR